MTVHRISNSELRTFRRCRRKWWLGNVRKLELDRPDVSGPRSIGTRVHHALQVYYHADTWDRQAAYEDARVTAEEDQVRVQAFADRQAAEGSEYPLEIVLADQAKDTELVLIMLEGYFDWLEESAVDANLEVVAVEEEIEVPLMQVDGEDWHLIGKLDQRTRKRDSGFTSFLDFKTVGNLTDIPKQAQMNEQGLTYNVLLKLLTGEHVDGMTFRMLRKVKRTRAAKPPFFGEVEARWNTEQLNNYVTRIRGIIKDLARCEAELAAGVSHQEAAYANPTSDCSWSCDYYPVCSMFDDGSRVEDALAAFYREHDPMARYETERVTED